MMSADRGYAGQIAHAPEKPELFTAPITRAEGSLRELEQRVARIVDCLAGPIPRPDETNSFGNSPSSGLLPDVRHVAELMSNRIQNIHDDLNRIEAFLG